MRDVGVASARPVCFVVVITRGLGPVGVGDLGVLKPQLENPMRQTVEPQWRRVNPTPVFKRALEGKQVALYAHFMTDSLNAALAPLAAHIRGIGDHRARYGEIEAAEELFRSLKHALLKEIALEMRAKGSKWKEIGDTLGGVTYQRAFQIGRRE